MEGQVYVPVQANETTMTTFAVRSGGGSIGTSYTLYWVSPGGITGNGWTFPDGRAPQLPLDPTVDDINNALYKMSFYYSPYSMQEYFSKACFKFN